MNVLQTKPSLVDEVHKAILSERVSCLLHPGKRSFSFLIERLRSEDTT